LRLLNALFNRYDSVLRSTPFDEFRVEFDDSTSLGVVQQRTLKPQEEQKLPENTLTFDVKTPTGTPQTYSLKTRELDERMLSLIDQVVPFLNRVGRQTWRDLRTGERLSVRDVLERYADELPRAPTRERKDVPGWLTKARSRVPIQLIEAQRLVTLRAPEAPSQVHGEPNRPIPVVEQYTRELVVDIQKRLADYAKLSQSLDRSFPVRLVRYDISHALPDEVLSQKLRQLENKRERLAEAGLLVKGAEDEFRPPTEVDATNRKVLSVYVEDVEQKLGVLDDILGKIEVLRRAIGDHFQFKELRIDQERGYVFVTPGGQELRPRDLSSGEQHELVLNHELLFRVKPHSLILIDEPELSFHVAWQQAFLKDLQVITKLGDLDILIATHSPNIIFDRSDLTVALEAPTQEQPRSPDTT
jgi:AAA domain, putative AbiEii toxin, Type IV TA system